MMTTTKKFTAATINAELKKTGEYRIRQQYGYIMVYGGDSYMWFTSSIPVCFVRHLGDTLEEAMDSVNRFIADQIEQMNRYK